MRNSNSAVEAEEEEEGGEWRGLLAALAAVTGTMIMLIAVTITTGLATRRRGRPAHRRAGDHEAKVGVEVQVEW